jgi:hypothetical protein
MNAQDNIFIFEYIDADSGVKGNNTLLLDTTFCFWHSKNDAGGEYFQAFYENGETYVQSPMGFGFVNYDLRPIFRKDATTFELSLSNFQSDDGAPLTKAIINDLNKGQLTILFKPLDISGHPTMDQYGLKGVPLEIIEGKSVSRLLSSNNINASKYLEKYITPEMLVNAMNLDEKAKALGLNSFKELIKMAKGI